MDSSERFLGEVRKYLALASEFERSGQIELADAAGAVASNKLAAALRIAERSDKPVVLRLVA